MDINKEDPSVIVTLVRSGSTVTFFRRKYGVTMEELNDYLENKGYPDRIESKSRYLNQENLTIKDLVEIHKNNPLCQPWG